MTFSNAAGVESLPGPLDFEKVTGFYGAVPPLRQVNTCLT